jgi:hypothetical protein
MSTTKRIIDVLSVEDLISIATSSKEEVIMDKLTPAAKFIYDIGIKSGDAKVPAYLIYHTYREWHGWENKGRQSRTDFFRDFCKHFESHRTKDGIHYLLNPKPFDLSKEKYWEIRATLRHEKSRRKKKK